MGAEKAKHQFEVLYEKIIKRFEAPTLLRKCQEKKKEERRVTKGNSKGKPAGRWVHQRVSLGFGVQLVNAEDQEISTHCTIEKDLFPALRAESGGRWKKMES